ncbi:MAG: hypothetical protein JWO03_2209 [Bacteroidetes bacterium]|nr:hypothetical protein [Bacteroidota bacterium]
MKTIIFFITILLSLALSAQDTIPGPSGGKYRSAVIKSDDNSLMTFDGVRATSHVSDKLVRKRNTGMGMTIAGLSLFTVGTILIATAPWQPHYSPYGSVSYSTTPAGIVGVLMIPVSIGVTIPGAVIWGRYAAKIRKAQRPR